MTQQKHLKARVRARMAKTGERYAAARRHVVASAQPGGRGDGVDARDGDPPPGDGAAVAAETANLALAATLHFPGSIPATTALRTLLAAAGVRDPSTGAPLSEAMCFGIAGGIGIGVFAFNYAREGFASLFLAGRHRWQDDLGYLTRAADRLGVASAIVEHGGAKAAAAALEASLAEGRPIVAWVDAASLPHRAMPAAWQGGSYHVITVHAIDPEAGVAWIGDLADDLIPVPSADLAAARARIKQQKHRLLYLESPGRAETTPDLGPPVRDGLRACHEGLTGAEGIGTARGNFSLSALDTLARRMDGGGKDGWAVVFPRGSRAWTALTSLHDFVEHYGTGGGLSRPIFADFLAQAAERLGDPRLADLGRRYAGLGAAWTDLADATLPDRVPLLADAKALLAAKAEQLDDGAPAQAVRATWDALGALGARAADAFPLDDGAWEALRRDLAARVRAIHADEAAAHAALGEACGIGA